MLLFMGGNVFAANIWNTASNDCATITIANFTTNTGYTNPCWTNSTVNANPGDYINVRVYYHNTSSTTATNTRILLNSPSGSSTSHTFSGQITSPEGNLSFGPVTVNIPTAQTLTWGTTKWYPNQSQTATDLSNGTDINIGNIAPGWDTQGSVVIGFQVGNYTPSQNCAISNFNANPTSITSGAAATLSWNTNNCSSVNISNLNYNVPTSGSQVVYPTATTTYTLIAYGTNGTQQSQSVTVFVSPIQNNCTISNFNASSTSIVSGGSSTLIWNTSNCTSVNISNLNYNVPVSGSQVVYPTYTTSYVLTAYGSAQQAQSQSVTVYVNSYVAPVVTACAISTIPTNVTQNSATLNGILTGSGNYSTYFEYGPTINLGFQTVARSSNWNTLFSDTITGLNSENIYYFRLVSNCQNGNSRGDLKVFQTLSSTVKPVIIQGTTIVGASSPIMLKIENRSTVIKTGDTIYYVVTYKNVGSKKLTRPIVQVVIPDGVSYLSSSRGAYSENTKTLNVPIEDLNAGGNGTIFLEGRLDSIKPNNREIVTTALLVYTNEKGTQENAMAYVLNNLEGNNSLSAAAFFSGFLKIGLLGWLLILIIILLLILIFRKYFYPKPYLNTQMDTHTEIDTHTKK